MKRQPYFPRTVDARPEWFGNYATQLPIQNAVLALPAPGATASVADARFLEYATGPWVTAVREFGPGCTSALEDLFFGTGTDPFVPPGFMVPALPPGPPPVVPVAPGALTRIFAYVQMIKAAPAYTESIGLLLGIVGSAEPAVSNPVPTFSLKAEQGGAGFQVVRITFKKYGHSGVAIYGRRGGGAWELLGIDMTTPYLDERPLLVAATPEIRDYRLRFYDESAPVGDYTDVASTLVGP
jgi:hypothetical protein